jgi:hypothetical protein
MLDIIMNLLLSAVSSAFGAVLNVDTMQRVFFFVTSVLSSENPFVTVVPMAVGTALFGVRAVTVIQRFFYPRDANNNGGGGGGGSRIPFQALWWSLIAAAFCIFLRWPVTMLIMAVLGFVQLHLNWIPQELGWKLVAQATLTWILSAVLAHHTTEALWSCYRKVTSWIVAAVKGLVAGVFRTIANSVTWVSLRALRLFFPSRSVRDATEQAEVEQEVSAPSFFIADQRFAYDMDDYVYDSDYVCEDEPESDIEYEYDSDSDHYDSNDENEESSQEDWHLGESHQARHCVEEVHEKNTIVPTFLMSGASTLRRSSRLLNVPSPCYTSGRVDYSMY